MELPVPYLAEHGFDGLFGMEYLEISSELMQSRVAVREELKQPAGLVHGGVYAAIAESLASLGTALSVMPEGKVATGLSNNTSFLRPITSGTINAEARPRHRGRTTWVWEVEITDDERRLCVLSRVTIAVRDAPAPGGG